MGERKHAVSGIYFFTFGSDHTNPITGESLAGRYVRLQGTVDGTRDEMVRRFGNRWAFQYSAANGSRGAGVERFRLQELVLTGRRSVEPEENLELEEDIEVEESEENLELEEDIEVEESEITNMEAPTRRVPASLDITDRWYPRD
jgi:hypothetical protein